MAREDQQIVVADANILINLLHVDRLAFFGQQPHLGLVVPDEVHQEVIRQRSMLDRAITEGWIRRVSIQHIEDLQRFAELTAYLGRGEAACLVLALRHRWVLASDERGRFRREAISKLGGDRLLGTVDLYLDALIRGLLSVAEADADKARLERNRFRLPFHSFEDLMP